MTFGSGTRLKVQPKREQALKPSVYALRPSPPDNDDVQVSAACLASDYYPNNYTLNIFVGRNATPKEQKGAQISIQDRSYSLLTFFTGSWSEVNEMTCKATSGSTTVKDADQDDDGRCIEIEDDDKDGENIRGLSVTVFGMRMLFFKSIIFNVLMSVRVWIS